ncbi:MAG: hypothetical protein JO301_18295 [Chitinophagaceae bacterium]|nr:hypothetical protein [Chitinophagaceae bacterium]
MRYLLFLHVILFSLSASAQVKPFARYAFEKGGYAIVGLHSESDPNALQASLGEFYTDDIALMNEIKRSWVFTKKIPVKNCGYHYSIQVTHHGKIVQDMLINLNCNIISSDNGYYYFSPEKLARLAPRLKKPVIITQSFRTRAEGIRFIDSSLHDKRLLLSFEPLWMQYEGKFAASYRLAGKLRQEKSAQKSLESAIRKKYPAEKFRLSWLASAKDVYDFDIICNQSLFNRYTLTAKKNWKPYIPEVTMAWRP